MRELCIAGRGSELAMAQNRLVQKLLEKEGYKVNILTVSTHGDRDRKSSVTALGGNGPFVRDVEKALTAPFAGEDFCGGRRGVTVPSSDHRNRQPAADQPVEGAARKTRHRDGI